MDSCNIPGSTSARIGHCLIEIGAQAALDERCSPPFTNCIIWEFEEHHARKSLQILYLMEWTMARTMKDANIPTPNDPGISAKLGAEAHGMEVIMKASIEWK